MACLLLPIIATFYYTEGRADKSVREKIEAAAADTRGGRVLKVVDNNNRHKKPQLPVVFLIE